MTGPPEYKMTQKQIRFCEEYLIDCNATRAAKAAGYAPKAAYRTGSENLHKPQIKAYLQQRLDAINNAKIAKADEVLEYLTSVMRGESRSEIVMVEGLGDGVSEARRILKAPDEKERTKAAELLGKRMALWDGSGKQAQSNGLLESLIALVEKQQNGQS